MFHHQRRASKDLDGHGARVAGRGSFDRFIKNRQRNSSPRNRSCCWCLCCRSGSSVVKVQPQDSAAAAPGDEEEYADSPWGLPLDFRAQQQQLAARQREARPHGKTAAMEKLHTRLHQNPQDLGTSMDGVSAQTFFKARPEEYEPARRRHSIMRSMAQAKANTRVMARRVSGVFARSEQSDARRTEATRAAR